MKLLQYTFIFLILSLISCSQQDNLDKDLDIRAEVSKTVAEEFDLALGETVLIKPESLTISFKDVTEDSRCPLNVQCIWAGRVSIQLEIIHNNRELAVVLSKGDGKGTDTFDIDDIRITLIEVLPYPKDPGIIELEDYTIKLIVNKI